MKSLWLEGRNFNLTSLPTRSEERGVLGVGSIPVAILPSCQDMRTIVLQMHKHEYSWAVKIRNASEAVPQALVSMMAWGSIVALILSPLCFLY